jgi:kynurenine formamidase
MCTETSFRLMHRGGSTTTGTELAEAPAAHHAGASLTRRAALLGGAAAAATAALGAAPAEASAPADAFPGRRGPRDLTYPLTTSFPAFTPGEEAARRTVVTIENDGYYLQEWRIIEHIGTHVDAPGHFTLGGRLSPELHVSELITPAVVIDIADRAAGDPDTTVTVDDVRAFEHRHGRIPRDAAVLSCTPAGAPRSATRTRTAARTRPGSCTFPGSARRRQTGYCGTAGSGVSVSTLSIDPGNSATFDTHLILTGADRYGIENLANLDRIPKRGATIIVGLIPYEEGSGGQARVIATW